MGAAVTSVVVVTLVGGGFHGQDVPAPRDDQGRVLDTLWIGRVAQVVVAVAHPNDAEPGQSLLPYVFSSWSGVHPTYLYTGQPRTGTTAGKRTNLIAGPPAVRRIQRTGTAFGGT